MKTFFTAPKDSPEKEDSRASIEASTIDVLPPPNDNLPFSRPVSPPTVLDQTKKDTEENKAKTCAIL